MTVIALRDYQTEAIGKVESGVTRGVRRQLGVAATGLGKTIMFSALAERMEAPTLILAHRDELITQAVDKLKQVWPDADVGVIKAARNEIDHQVVVGSVQTLARRSRLEQLPTDKFGLVVIDEAHHAKATSYVNICEHLRAGKEDGPVLLGVTATPDRGDGKGLDDIFDEIIFSYDMLWGIRSGYLADLRGMRVYLEDVNFSDAKIRKGDYDVGETGRMLEAADAPALIAEAWQKYASERKTIVFTPTVATATMVRDELQALGASAEMVSGETPLEERRDILKRFSTGEVQVVANCMVLTEGFDEPAASCIVMARPTRSRALYAQCIGRGSRRHPDKDDCLVIDVVGVSDELSLVTIPSLFGIEKKDGFEAGEETVAAAVQEQEETAVRKGKLAAAAVELFRKVLESPIAWVHYETRFGKKAYQCQLGDRDLGTVVIEHTVNQAPDLEIPMWDCYLRWDAKHAPIAGSGVRSLPNGDATRTLISGVDLEMAQGTGEDYVRKNGVSALTDRNAAWRKRPPTERQIEAANKWGLRINPEWSAGQLSDEMSAHIAKKKERSRNTPQWVKDKYRSPR